MLAVYNTNLDAIPISFTHLLYQTAFSHSSLSLGAMPGPGFNCHVTLMFPVVSVSCHFKYCVLTFRNPLG